MSLLDIEGQLFAIADSVREQNGQASRRILAIVAELRAWHQAETNDWYVRHSEMMRKWNAFSNSMNDEEYRRQKEIAEEERARVLRILAVDPRWEGSYADLAKLTAKD